MTLMKKRAAETLQQVKDLARSGNWIEAKRLAATLPNTPDNNKLRERIEKQLFIATGEVPSVMENSMIAADDDIASVPAWTNTQPAKSKRADENIPSYWAIRGVAYLIYGGGVLATVVAVAIFTTSFFEKQEYFAIAARTTAFTIFVSGFFTIASGSMILMFVDIARNTFRTNNLLTRLLERDNR